MLSTQAKLSCSALRRNAQGGVSLFVLFFAGWIPVLLPGRPRVPRKFWSLCNIREGEQSSTPFLNDLQHYTELACSKNKHLLTSPWKWMMCLEVWQHRRAETCVWKEGWGGWWQNYKEHVFSGGLPREVLYHTASLLPQCSNIDINVVVGLQCGWKMTTSSGEKKYRLKIWCKTKKTTTKKKHWNQKPGKLLHSLTGVLPKTLFANEGSEGELQGVPGVGKRRCVTSSFFSWSPRRHGGGSNGSGTPTFCA